MILTLRLGDQPRDLVLTDHPAPLPRDSSVRVANCTEGERLRTVKEDKRKKRQRKLLVRERGEDTNSDDDNNVEDDDKVFADTKWDDLESEDMLIGIRSSLQGSGPFPFQGGEGASVRLAKKGRTVDLPQEPAGVGRSATALESKWQRVPETRVPDGFYLIRRWVWKTFYTHGYVIGRILVPIGYAGTGVGVYYPYPHTRG